MIGICDFHFYITGYPQKRPTVVFVGVILKFSNSRDVFNFQKFIPGSSFFSFFLSFRAENVDDNFGNLVTDLTRIGFILSDLSAPKPTLSPRFHFCHRNTCIAICTNITMSPAKCTISVIPNPFPVRLRNYWRQVIRTIKRCSKYIYQGYNG